MKKVLLILLCALIIGGCHNKSKQSVITQSNKTDDSSALTMSWYGHFNKGNMTLDIEETNDYEEALIFTLSDGKSKYEDYGFFETDQKVTCDLGEDGIIITLTKGDDAITISVEGNFDYLNGDITGSYRRSV